MFTGIDLIGILGMLAIRMGIPIAVMAGLVYVLRRLDRQWEAEARREWQAAHPEEQPAARPVQAPARQPSGRPDKAGRQVPLAPGLTAAGAQRPCWQIQGCSEATYKKCPAYSHQDQPCWQARLSVEGKIPENCVACAIFQRYPAM